MNSVYYTALYTITQEMKEVNTEVSPSAPGTMVVQRETSILVSINPQHHYIQMYNMFRAFYRFMQSIVCVAQFADR